MFAKMKRHIKYWKYAGVTLPYTALTAIIGMELLDLNTTRDYILFGGLIIFSSVCIIWWWWTIAQIVTLLQALENTEKHLIDVKSYLRDTKDMLKTNHDPILDEIENVNNRKR